MAQSSGSDLYAVAAGTSEVRVFKITQTARSGLALEKLTTLTNHAKEILFVAFCNEYCATISKDLTLVIQKIDLNQFSSKLIAQKTFDINEYSKVAIIGCENNTVLVAVTLQ